MASGINNNDTKVKGPPSPSKIITSSYSWEELILIELVKRWPNPMRYTSIVQALQARGMTLEDGDSKVGMALKRACEGNKPRLRRVEEGLYEMVLR